MLESFPPATPSQVPSEAAANPWAHGAAH
jgi:hypothetical protein